MTILVTGAAGFLGMHVALRLLDRGEHVVGVDNLNDYYSLELKEARLCELEERSNFRFHYLDIGDAVAGEELFALYPDVTGIVHLAGQVGVGHSRRDPQAFLQTNVTGMYVLLEECRQLAGLRHLVYASSSAVYGGNRKVPFAESDLVSRPRSVYAVSKQADELLAAAYAHLYNIPMTGLRLFAIYGPWGRPDMFYYSFTRAVLTGEVIKAYNGGDFRRDFTYVDDAVTGIVSALDHPPTVSSAAQAPHCILNIGNDHADSLRDFVAEIERVTGRQARLDNEPMKADDLPETFADIDLARGLIGFDPKTPLSEGVARFVDWYRTYHQ